MRKVKKGKEKIQMGDEGLMGESWKEKFQEKTKGFFTEHPQQERHLLQRFLLEEDKNSILSKTAWFSIVLYIKRPDSKSNGRQWIVVFLSFYQRYIIGGRLSCVSYKLFSFQNVVFGLSSSFFCTSLPEPFYFLTVCQDRYSLNAHLFPVWLTFPRTIRNE